MDIMLHIVPPTNTIKVEPSGSFELTNWLICVGHRDFDFLRVVLVVTVNEIKRT